MATKDTTKKPSKLKPLLVVVGVLAGVYLLLMGVMMASDWYKIRQYKALATEIDQTLGGSFKISYNWRCELESSNCPSARLLMDVNFKDNDEARTHLNTYAAKLNRAGYINARVTYCGELAGMKVYCELETTKNGKNITINAKQNFIGIDIQS